MIEPLDFLTQAEKWIALAEEVDWRSAVSRGYYAAFHEARRLLQEMGFQVPRGPQAHGYLWLRISNGGDPVVRLAGADLNELQRSRNRADYDIDRDVTFADAAPRVGMARRIIERLRDARVEPTRTQIQDAMRDYERNVLHQVTWQGP